MLHPSPALAHTALRRNATNRVQASKSPSDVQTSRRRCTLFITFSRGLATTTAGSGLANAEAHRDARAAARKAIRYRIAAQRRLGATAKRWTRRHLSLAGR